MKKVDPEQSVEEKYNELIMLLRIIMPGNGNINFDGRILEQIRALINPNDDWNYNNQHNHGTKES